jgi:hypothetical protein
MTRLRVLLALPLVLAACGGTGAATPGPVATGTSTTTTETTTDMTDTETSTETTDGAGAEIDYCLNTAAEVEAALKVSGVTATGSGAPGIGGGCSYITSDGILVHSVAIISSQGFEATFETAKQAPGAVEIAGLGKGAVLVSAQGPLAILMDNGVISMGPTGPAQLMADPSAYRTAVEALARTAVGRMP